MTKRRRRKCLSCRRLFRPDPPNVRHQRYCSKPACRKASKAASQTRWLAKSQNRNYFQGPDAQNRRVEQCDALAQGIVFPSEFVVGAHMLPLDRDSGLESTALFTESPLKSCCVHFKFTSVVDK